MKGLRTVVKDFLKSFACRFSETFVLLLICFITVNVGRPGRELF